MVAFQYGVIKRLSNEIISKTKAGQVVSDQTDVIKDLVENSLDAKAHQVEIALLRNGLDQIYVGDDGVGMGADDLKICSKSYTTSKIYSIEDLVGIKSLGFRGEALHGIDTVSDLVVKSLFGEGTQVYVNNLFAKRLFT